VVAIDRGGRTARTDWMVIERFGARAALLRCTIHSGRTHQIRVHLKSIGLAVLGDRVYGYRPDPRLPVAPPRVMLHAERIAVRHPVTGRSLDLRAPLPADFRVLLAALRNHRRARRRLRQTAPPAPAASRPGGAPPRWTAS